MIPPDKHLQIGSLAFDELDQMDLTGPFEVLACLPNCTHRIFAKTAAPVRDVHGLKLVPDAALADVPQLDVLHIPGGFGQEALMEDEDVLGWIRRQAKGAQCVFAVCTGVLMCGGSPQRPAGDHPLVGASSPAFLWRRAGQQASGGGRKYGLCRRRHLGDRRRALTLQPSCAAMKWPRPYSSIWNMRPNRPSTVARLRPHQRTSSMRCDIHSKPSRRDVKRRRGGSLTASA
jgi:putative intracellular protease/amidase